MKRYNNRLGMKDLFMNSSLSEVFPQFSGVPLQNVYSFAETEKRVLDYLKGIFGGTVTGKGELVIVGKHKNVLRQVKALKGLMENLFNSMPSIAKNLRRNTKLYMSFSSISQLQAIKSPEQHMTVLNEILENINYNPDFASQNRFQGVTSFARKQAEWQRRVNYKERR